MSQITKSSFVLLVFMICMNVAGQNRDNDILSDSSKLAEYIYNNMHYPLIDFINNVEGTTIYKIDFDSIMGINKIIIVKSSGSASLDREGERLIWQIPIQENQYHSHEIVINFKLADNKIYNASNEIEKMPEFPGGNTELLKFISQNLNWPPEAADMGIQGRIICGFVIEKDGTISIVEIVKSLDRLFDAEAIRVIKRMPEWTAGKKDGKPVRVYLMVPIIIKLIQEP